MAAERSSLNYQQPPLLPNQRSLTEGKSKVELKIEEKKRVSKTQLKYFVYSLIMKIRVGFGYDVHKLVAGRDLWIGGIKIDHEAGLLGHSDADVLIHAICDALLGAANMRDIGYHFPDTSADTLNIDSKILLKKTMELVAAKGYELGNIDATICAERPKMNPHIPAMKQCLSTVMDCDIDDISIKATTTEKLGFTGREEGISAYATVLIYSGKR